MQSLNSLGCDLPANENDNLVNTFETTLKSYSMENITDLFKKVSNYFDSLDSNNLDYAKIENIVKKNFNILLPYFSELNQNIKLNFSDKNKTEIKVNKLYLICISEPFASMFKGSWKECFNPVLSIGCSCPDLYKAFLDLGKRQNIDFLDSEYYDRLYDEINGFGSPYMSKEFLTYLSNKIQENGELADYWYAISTETEDTKLKIVALKGKVKNLTGLKLSRNSLCEIYEKIKEGSAHKGVLASLEDYALNKLVKAFCTLGDTYDPNMRVGKKRVLAWPKYHAKFKGTPKAKYKSNYKLVTPKEMEAHNKMEALETFITSFKIPLKKIDHPLFHKLTCDQMCWVLAKLEESLEEIKIYNFPAANLNRFSRNSKLKVMDFSNSPELISLEGVEKLTNLQTLILDNCVNLSDIQPILNRKIHISCKNLPWLETVFGKYDTCVPDISVT